MKKIASILILCILAVAIGYVVHQTHSSTELQLGESGIVNDIAFVVLDYEFSDSYISRYGRIEYPEEGAKFLWLYVKATNLGEVAQRIPDEWDVDILYKGTTIHHEFANPKERKMYERYRKIYPSVSEEGWIAYQVPKNFYISQAKVRVRFSYGFFETLTWSLGPEYQSVLVTQVVDGDTITVEGGLRVRLIGIDAPERGEKCYTEGKEYLNSMILHKVVNLEMDITDKDQYGRSLRYVWLDTKLVNAEIVRAGFAIAKQYDPDTKYQHFIADTEQEAIKKQVGCLWRETPTVTPLATPVPTPVPTTTPILTPTPSPTKTKWKSSDEGVISYLDAGKYIGQTKTVEGTIVKTFKYIKGEIIFLNFHDPYQGYFTAIIWSSDWDKFPFAPEVYYKGKEVRVTGEIIEYEGTPEIVVRDPSQIEVAYEG
jgi:micrococcal nuclease